MTFEKEIISSRNKVNKGKQRTFIVPIIYERLKYYITLKVNKPALLY